MDTKQFHRRVWGVVALLCLMLLGMGATLYDLQIQNGADFFEQSQYKIAETETVEADRGDILDRNGRVLVSNQVIYQVTLNPALMGAQRNNTLLALIRIAQESGVEWGDTLPISAQAPFQFTTDEPYYTVTTDETGAQQKTLTRLGRLAVRMKWCQDPTKEPSAPAPVTQSSEAGFFQRLLAQLTGKPIVQAPPDEETQSAPPAPEAVTLPDATTLLGLMCASFSLTGEGALEEKDLPPGDSLPALNIGDMHPADARAVAGVMYELSLRTQEILWTPYVFAADVDIDFISRVKEQSLTGVVIDPTTIRRYSTDYAAHLLGRIGLMNESEWAQYREIDRDGDGVGDYQLSDSIGKEGVERAFEEYLRGSSGVRTVERNISGKVVSQSWITEPKPGNNVVLTIDLSLQQKVEDVLASSLPKLGSKDVQGAACVVLEVDGGGVLASASYPTFSLADYSQDYAENAQNALRPLYNRALQGTYAPGSTFKMVTAVAGLEEGIITPNTRIRDEGRYTFYTANGPMCWIFRQFHSTHGLQNVSDAIKNSCNYFFYDVGRRLGITPLTDYATRFGLGEKTGIELNESSGVMAGPEVSRSVGQTWYDGNILSVAIGQENSQFTPIQLANYIATLVNGGERYSTHLLKEIKSHDFSQIVDTYLPKTISTININPDNLNAVKMGMLALTTSGSVASYFRGLEVQAGAKTGSAQVSTQTEANAVFVCFAPYDNPEIAVALVVEHGGSGTELGAMAADILAYYFSAQESMDEVPRENTLIR